MYSISKNICMYIYIYIHYIIYYRLSLSVSIYIEYRSTFIERLLNILDQPHYIPSVETNGVCFYEWWPMKRERDPQWSLRLPSYQSVPLHQH